MTKARIDKILLVDDDRQLQENLCTFFSSNGLNTVSLFSGRGVLEAISKESPCAVLLDVMLPDGADGFEDYQAYPKQIRSIRTHAYRKG